MKSSKLSLQLGEVCAAVPGGHRPTTLAQSSEKAYREMKQQLTSQALDRLRLSILLKRPKD
jgi:hypothetical protein